MHTDTSSHLYFGNIGNMHQHAHAITSMSVQTVVPKCSKRIFPASRFTGFCSLPYQGREEDQNVYLQALAKDFNMLLGELETGSMNIHSTAIMA